MGIKVNYCYPIISLEEKREECGIVAIYSKKGKNVTSHIYKSLFALQHRGQDAAGFAVFDGKKIQTRTGIGLVDQIFKKKDLEVGGIFGIGHTRYPTIGECRLCDVQPTIVGKTATAHNGHVANYEQLRRELEEGGHEFISTNDSEVLACLLDQEKDIETGIKRIMERVEGAYSDVAIVNDKLVIFRDPFAIRPLAWGENEEFICFASETAAFDTMGVKYQGEVLGGELIVIQNGKTTKKRFFNKTPHHCMFEFVYFSRPDSIIDGREIYQIRRRLGETLANEAPVEAEIVIAIPDTSRTAAARYAEVLDLPIDEGLIKNRYIGRTFIMPSQEKRVEAVRLKLNPISSIIVGKRVVLVDDSIVRGTTLREIVKIVKEAGAREVHVRITCPPVRAPCFYGVDMSTYSELIASQKTIEQIREFLGVNSLAYISINGLRTVIGLPLCTACLTGKYNSEFVKKLAVNEKKKEKTTKKMVIG